MDDIATMMGAGASGWSRLGAAVGGLGTDPDMRPGYLRGAQAGASIANIMAEGRDRQAKFLGREALAKHLEDSGDTDSAGAIRAGVDPQQVLAAKKIKAELDTKASIISLITSAHDAGQPYDDSYTNRLTQANEGHPFETQRVEEQNLVTPFDTLVPGTMPPTTAQGVSLIADRMAAARDHDAAGRQHDAGAHAADALAATRTAGDPLYDARVDAANRSNRGHAHNTPLDNAIARAMDPNGTQTPNPSPLGAVGNIVAAFLHPGAAPAAQPAAPAHPGNAAALAKARDAIARGADPAKVKARLQAAGIDPAGL